MNNKNLILSSILAIILATGCASTGSKSALKEEAREAIGQTQEDWAERKSDFISKSQTRINDIDSDLQAMNKKRGVLKESTRDDATEAIGETKSLLSSVRTELGNLMDVSAEDWQSEQNSFQREMNILEAKFTEARKYYY